LPVAEKLYVPIVPVGNPIVKVKLREVSAGIEKILDHISVEPESAGSVIVEPLKALVPAE
jgi:hypothetical protein